MKPFLTNSVQLAIARFRNGDIKRSLEDLDQAGSIALSNEQLDIATICMANQSIVYSKMKRYSKAIETIHQAIVLSLKTNNQKSFEVIDFIKCHHDK